MSAEAGEIAGERRQFRRPPERGRGGTRARKTLSSGRLNPPRIWPRLSAKVARALEDEWERGHGFCVSCP